MVKAHAPLLFAVVLAGAIPASALDPDRSPSQYVFRRWGAGTDLPSQSVHAVLQTRDRYLWLATSSGLVRFDGARFLTIDAGNTPGFGDGVVTTLSEAPDGSLYLGMTSAVLCYKDGAFTTLPVETGTGVSSALLAARDGSVWIGLLGRPLFRWMNGQVHSQYRRIDTTGPRAFVEDEHGAVWIGTRREGLYRFDGAQFTREADVADTIQALCFDRGGSLWMGTPHGLLRRHPDGRLERFSKANGLSNDDITAILEDRDGNLWIGTAGGGVSRLRGGRIQHFTARHGLTGDDVRSLYEDHEGNLWIGTAEGLNRLGDGRFVTYGRPEGLADPAVTAAIESADGSVWIGTASGGVSRLRGGAIEHFTLPGGPGKDNILALHEAKDGALWIGLDNSRLFRLKNGVVSEHTAVDAPRTWKASTIGEDDGGVHFFITGVGLARVEGRRTVAMHANAPRLGFVYQVLQDRRGTWWLCGSLGLARVVAGEYKVYTTRDGLPHDRVRSASEDEDGGLWLATIGGLAHIDTDGRVRSLTRKDGLPEDHLRLVLDDRRGYLWLVSVGTIARVSKEEVRARMDGGAAKVQAVTFDTSDGLRTSESALSSNPGFRGRDGRLWFATLMGVAVVDPARVTTGDAAPPVAIERVAVDTTAGMSAEYPPGRGEVTIEYTSLSFRSASKQRFRYRLEGLDTGWVEAGNRRTAYYSNLPPGRYAFSVMASNHDGLWNGEPALWTFTLKPPFYRRPAFYAATLAAAAGLIALAHRLRVNRMRERFTAILRERTRIARELHDTLAQGLAGVGMQLDTALKILPGDSTLERARAQIERSRSVIRMSLAEVRRSIWVLRAQTAKDANDLPSSLSTNLAHLTAESGIGARFSVTGRPRPLSSELEHNLLRIAHEAVTNAVRHSNARTITIGLHFDDDHLDLRVQDDGQGFDPESAQQKAQGAHFGLAGLSERTRALGGEMKLASRPGSGTEIECRLPYRNRGGIEPPQEVSTTPS
jgi:signal transduction histidine kinase/ligand-binding sensor domain-containing protein